MKFFRLALLFSFLFFGELYSQPLKARVRAQSAILYNPENGAILFEKDPHRTYYPASTTKLATALFVLEGKKIDLATPMRASRGATQVVNASVRQEDILNFPPYVLEHDGIMMGLDIGEVHSLRTLLHSLLLCSTCDAANVIAECTSGSIEEFMKEMQVFLRKKGLVATKLVNPHGLFHPAHTSTAYEMALLASWTFQNEQLKKILGTGRYTCCKGKGALERTIQNKNALIKKGKFQYEKALGGKTGYIKSAGRNLVACAEHEGRRLIAVLFGCEEKNQRYEDAIGLFELAFQETKEQRLLFPGGEPLFKRKIPLAKFPLRAAFQDGLHYFFFPSEERELKAKIYWHELPLPIEEGQCVGEVVVSDLGNREVTRAPIYAANRVEENALYHFREWIHKKRRRIWVFLSCIFVFFGSRQLRKKRSELL